ncbi:MAG: hypothetical protein DMD33_18760 [Gemmatimonadetes bacterium]|nr:MAG: hypothetical protein DMD33_18760 [Gemmatimonadota bacterium]
MRYEAALRKHTATRELSEYETGYIDGLKAYSWMRDGATYVGTTGRTLGDAVDRFLTEHRR